MNAGRMVMAVVAAGMTCAALAQPLVMEEKGLLPGDGVIAPATNSQQNHAVAKGGDQYLVVWRDLRGSSSGSQTSQSESDIFGIRLDSAGNPVDAAPFAIASRAGYQMNPRVAWNGNDWLVLYVSQETGPTGYYEDQLKAVRVSAGGQVLDATPIGFPAVQFEPNTIGLQLGGVGGNWLVTRCIYHDDGYGTFLAGQRISASGQLLDQTPVMLLDWVYGATNLLSANGEYLVAGPDWNTNATKAQRVSAALTPIGGSFTLPGSTIATSGSEFYVVWIKEFVNLVGSRVTSSGTLLTPNGTTLVANFSQYTHSTLTHDGTQWWLEWGVSDILRTVRINSAGTVLDPNGGVLLPITIGGNVNTAYDPVLVGRTGGGVLLFWYDLRVANGYDTNVFTLPVSASNTALTERCVSTSTPNQRNADLSAGPNGTAAVAMVSELANDDRVVVHLLDSAGVATTNEPIEVYRGPTVGRVGIAFNGNVYMIVWDQGPSGTTPTEIKARRMNPNGTFVDATPVSVMPGFNPDVEALGANFLVGGARFGTYPQYINLYGNRIDGTTGAVQDGANGVFLGGNYVNGAVRVRTDGTKWLVCAHSQWTHDSSQGDAIMAVVPATGTPTQAVNVTPFAGSSGDLDVAFSGSNYLLVWRQNSLANANNLVAGRLMNVDGSYATGWFTIAEAAGRQLRPTVVWDGVNYVVALDDQRNQDAFYDARTDVYGVRVSQSGTIVDASGFAIVNGTNASCSPSLLAKGNGQVLVASTRFVLDAPMDSYRIGMTMIGATPVTCIGDFNQAGGVTVQDIFDYLSAWFGGLATADVNGTGGVTVQDIFDFLAAWFAGC